MTELYDQDQDGGERLPTVVRWERIGRNYLREFQDVSEHIDMVGLDEAISRYLNERLPTEFAVRIKLMVEIDGGKDLALSTGEGEIEVQLPKAEQPRRVVKDSPQS